MVMSLVEDFEFPLRGVVALVTGAASGIGRATAVMARAGGAKVGAVDIDETGLAALREQLGSDDADLGTDVMDVTDPRSVEKSLQRVTAALGTVNGLVCSAGTTFERPFLEISAELWNRVLQLNLAGTFFVAQAVARGMVAS